MRFSAPSRTRATARPASTRKPKRAPAPPAVQSFERQADVAAARALRPSERAAARGLTRAPAARAPTRSSRGVPLPRATRVLLEERFGAELSEVRVHTDAAAAEAADSVGALAFAAGREVYFAPGAFAPDLASGLALIAHEVAHVLQQTGRTDAHGVVHATAREGDGELMLASKPFPKTSRTTRPTLDIALGDNKVLAQIIGGYEAKFGGDAELTLAIDWFLDQLFTHDGGVYIRKPGSAPAKALDELAAQIKKDVDGVSAAARSFVVVILAGTDGGKGEVWWEAAATVLARDTKNQIVTPLNPDFLVWLKKKKDEDWIAPGLDHARIKPWFGDLIVAYTEWLTDVRTNSVRPLKAKDPVGGVERTWADQKKELKTATTKDVIINERVLLAIELLNKIDTDRIDTQKQWLADVAAETAKRKADKKLFLPFEIRLFLAGRMKEHFAAAAWSKRAKVWQRIAARMLKIATSAESFLKRGLAAIDKFNKVVGFEIKDLVAGDGGKFAGGLARTPELAELDKLLVKHAKILFDKPADAPPKSTDYAAAVAQLKLDLLRLFHELTGKVLVHVVSKPDVDLSTTFAWVLMWTRKTYQFLDREPFALAADLKDKAEIPPSTAVGTATVGPAEDLRRAHRHILAAVMLRAALFAELADVKKLAVAMIHADRKSRVLILEDWKPTEDPVTKMLEDFRLQEKKGKRLLRIAGRDLPFTVTQLVNFYNLIYLKAINDELESVLTTIHATAITKDTRIKVDSVRAKGKAVAQPKRWIAPKVIALLHPDDPKEFAEVVESSGKTRLQLKVPTHGSRVFAADMPSPPTPLFAWIFPDLTELVTFLRTNVPGINAMIKDLTGKAAPTNVVDWLIELTFLDGVQVRKLIREGIGSDVFGFPHERKRLLKASRELSALDRKIVKHIVEPKFEKWANRSYGGTGPDAYEAGKALDLIRRYRQRVEPYQDTDVQTAALMLDLGPKLDSTMTATKVGELSDETVQVWQLLAMGIGAAKEQRAGRKPRTSPLDPPQILLEDVLGRNETVSGLLAGQTGLENVQTRLKAYLEKQQEKTGFFSTSAGKLRSFRYAESFGPKEEFSWDNRTYTLRKIHTPFVYNPPLGGLPSKLRDGAGKDIPRDKAIPLFTIDIDDSEAPLGIATNVRSWALQGPSSYGALDAREKRRKLATAALPATASAEEREEHELRTESIKEEETLEKETGRYIVTSDDDKLLEVIAFAVELSAMNEGLQRTGTIIGGFMEVIITAAEIFLPGGQVILWAQMLEGAMSLVTSEEVRELVTTIKDDPKKLFAMIADRLTNVVSAENLWNVLLDDNPGGVMDKFASLGNVYRDLKGGKKPKRAKPRGKLGRIVQFIVDMGRRFLRAFGVLKMKFKRPLAAIRSAIVTRPRLAWMMMKALEFLGMAQRVLGTIDLQGEGLAATGIDAKAHILEFVHAVSDVELPGELIPLETLYGWLLSWLLGKIPKVKLIRPILDAAGWTDRLAGVLIGVIGVKGSWADPNESWKTLLRPAINDHFVTLKKDLLEGFLGLVNNVGQQIDKGFNVTMPGDDELKKNPPTLVGADEMEEFASDEPGLPATLSIPQGSGAPLSGGALADAQGSFGESFSHVRIHDDAASAFFTGSLGAEAATSGSHIYLGDGAAASPAQRTPILHHELAHVVQQTGSRPLGLDHSDTPVRGDVGPGLTFDPAHEAAADAAAAGGGIASSSGAALGIQPKLTDGLLRKVVGSLTHFRPGGAQFKAPVATGDVPGGPRAKDIWEALKKALDDPKKGIFKPFLSEKKEVKPAIIELITSTSRVTAGDIQGVAQLAQKNVRGKKTKDGDQVTELNPGRFVNLLEGFLYARSGVAMQITADHKGNASTGTTTITKVHVNYLHLPFLPYQGTAKVLWDHVMKSKSPTKALVKTGENVDVIRRMLKVRLEALDPDPFLWKTSSTAFELSDHFVNEFRKEYEDSIARGRPSTVDKADIYAQHDFKKNTTRTGLRVATHGELTAGARPDRESHHVPQFLLVEFFGNREDATLKAWPEKNQSSYAKLIGLEDGGWHLKSVAPGGTVFDFAKLDPKKGSRGDGLPAVLLAAETHRKGPLHLDDAEDDAGPAKAQSAMIAGKWKDLMPHDDLRSKDGAKWGAYIRKNPGAGTQLADAMKATYRWMYKEIMFPGLKRSLATFEKAYYDGLAASTGNASADGKLHAGFELQKSHTDPVWKAIETAQDLVKPFK